jgi:sugar fermentation stimulation protein A
MKEIFKFPKPLIKGNIIKRYKRFLADVLLPSGEIVTVHVPNSGSMKTCWQQDSQVILSDFSDRLDRKLKYSLQAVLMADGWVGVNTSKLPIVL